MAYLISGIQQMGIGIPDAEQAFKHYNRLFGMDVPVFRSGGVADLMKPYTGGRGWNRFAILAVNMQGGGGMEIWQHTERTPLAPSFTVQWGDLGILSAKIKCKNIGAFHASEAAKNGRILSDISLTPEGKPHFYLADTYGNIFEAVESHNWFTQNNRLTGGIYGATIGVSHMERSIAFYSAILGYSQVIYDTTGTVDSWTKIPGGEGRFRRVLLRHPQARKGAFSQLLGSSEIELVQSLDRQDIQNIYQNRFWGDLGFIHLCFDINGMDDLRKNCEAHGHPFTVDSSNSFDMGEASGHFAYIEDPDGALIEFVETHKVPILKKLGWYLNLKKRDPAKPLPKWMVKAMGLNKEKA